MILRTLSARFTSRLRSERVAAKLGMWPGLLGAGGVAVKHFVHRSSYGLRTQPWRL